MALSNWDTFALNEKGEPISGLFVSPLGVEVEIYKNWVYIRDEKAWTEDCGFTNNTVMHIDSGDFRYKDVCVLAIRGPQHGVCVAAYHNNWNDKILTGMVGIGCYGFNETDEWVGVTEDSVKFLREEFLRKTYREQYDLPNFTCSAQALIDRDGEGRDGELWPNAVAIGDKVIEYDSWEYEIPDELRNIDLSL